MQSIFVSFFFFLYIQKKKMSTEITKQDKIFFILKNIGIGLYIVLLIIFFMKSPLLQFLQSNVGKTKNLLPIKTIKTTYRELTVLCIFYSVITVFTVQFILEQKSWKRTLYILLEAFMTIFIIGLFLRTNHMKKILQKKNWFKQFQTPMIKK